MALHILHSFGAGNANAGIHNSMVNALVDVSYRVTCQIKVDNLTNVILDSPVVSIGRGQVDIPPKHIQPGQSDLMVARNLPFNSTGTYGTVSWLLERENRRVVVMWAAPFNLDFYDNWLAVGMTESGVIDHAANNEWYKQMYYKKSDKLLRFSKMKYQNEIQTVTYKEDGIEISGTMSTGHRAQAMITIRPLDISNNDDSIK
ncbi:hypothetical protein ACJMK2_039422 [Sinanodonta woodiana]|uniref:Uncharacterized protein n=1 Tax=Sinanodonta woodiana TaxID=1069815 RepID=A0ABD3WFC0_SINWO